MCSYFYGNRVYYMLLNEYLAFFLFIKFTDIIMSEIVLTCSLRHLLSPNLLPLNTACACCCQLKCELNYRYLISSQPEATRHLVNTMDILSPLKK